MKTPDTATQLVIESLRSTAETRLRVAQRAAGEVQLEKEGGKDVRSSAVKVTEMLAHADTCTRLADQLEAGSLVFAIPSDVADLATSSQSATSLGAFLDAEGLADDDADDSDDDVAEFDLTGGDPT